MTSSDPFAAFLQQVDANRSAMPAKPAYTGSTSFSGGVQPSSVNDLELSEEQQRVIDVALTGKDIIVDATCGSGKTATIQRLCNELNAATPGLNILYLTYSKLLKEDAMRRVTGAKVQNYHGIVYPSLKNAGINCGISESIATFNRRFKELSAGFPVYDVLIIDEYQDITEEYAQLLKNIKSKNPSMQIIMVGDMEQRVSAASRHNAQDFAKSFCVEPEFLSFTQSFRIGEQMAGELAVAWNKPISGVNTKQEIKIISYNEALKEMLLMTDRTGDILCLGKRNGEMTKILNAVESREPGAFNKNTVYASVRESESRRGMSPDSAIFTTFDSSKGLERDTCFIFDYDVDTFGMRLRFKDADPEILRNVFLVAASRGKNRVFFVDTSAHSAYEMDNGYIGLIPTEAFTDLPDMEREEYDQPFDVAGMFDFKYVETVDEAFDLLDVTRLDDGSGPEIEVEIADGLIDLTTVVNIYQKYEFFEKYSPERELASSNDNAMLMFGEQLQKMMVTKGALSAQVPADLNVFNKDGSITSAPMKVLDKWESSLALVSAVTNYDRYATQVRVRPSDDTMARIQSRLAEHLEPSDEVQQEYSLDGMAVWTRNETSDMTFIGVADVVRDDAIWELTFVTEITHPLMLRAAMLGLMAGKEKSIVWNIRTNERYEIRIPDEQRFLDAVVNCVTKQNYRQFSR